MGDKVLKEFEEKVLETAKKFDFLCRFRELFEAGKHSELTKACKETIDGILNLAETNDENSILLLYSCCFGIMSSINDKLSVDAETKALEFIDIGLIMCGNHLFSHYFETFAGLFCSNLPHNHSDTTSDYICKELPLKDELNSNLKVLNGVMSIKKFEELAALGKPFVIRNLASDWPCVKKWRCISFWQRYNNRIVPVEKGSDYTDPSWSMSLTKIETFLEDIQTTNNYIAQHNLLKQIPELAKDLEQLEFCFASVPNSPEGSHLEEPMMNVWFGGSNTISPLHYDNYNNILVQAVGYKFLRLIDPEFSSSLYPMDGELYNTSQINVMHPNYEKYPKFNNVPFIDVTLGPGDALYIPPLWWHYVQSLSPSISLSHWF
ncbi:Cupin-like domain-containing protein [Rozella allomycis CSF55]|uniref:Cupin-like domain-containing protein n=1 Tax=Rozella allomycis (strain CSF55) TaxID=988480 RepID=A0A075AZR8_ROZAC|nr:Cupin-like domain-containing protein [Rozella allomycis CSF55]|eukprot:EPZ35584.1 Cupin-like domain-containing protein [Rozella allomycis CSF55]